MSEFKVYPSGIDVWSKYVKVDQCLKVESQYKIRECEVASVDFHDPKDIKDRDEEPLMFSINNSNKDKWVFSKGKIYRIKEMNLRDSKPYMIVMVL
ncbi:MAG: hypothetical protein Solumvirus7_8 [Solumvirus sp.]|uniref:Uncharacterized protein n=1 Tax=Solumvirus sp. TaxID=2487773 RepID=A0A3G5AJX1_9VIRU|nr:MAG: hypothetical protein Solumvirus7_8 [Solumvirus sp.]